MQLLQTCEEDLLKLEEEDENAEEGLSLEQRFFFCLLCLFPQSGTEEFETLMQIIFCPYSVGNSCRGFQLPHVS